MAKQVFVFKELYFLKKEKNFLAMEFVLFKLLKGYKRNTFCLIKMNSHNPKVRRVLIMLCTPLCGKL